MSLSKRKNTKNFVVSGMERSGFPETQGLASLTSFSFADFVSGNPLRSIPETTDLAFSNPYKPVEKCYNTTFKT